jgi:hypothetical protein
MHTRSENVPAVWGILPGIQIALTRRSHRPTTAALRLIADVANHVRALRPRETRVKCVRQGFRYWLQGYAGYNGFAEKNT